jgi:hypothetical protein
MLDDDDAYEVDEQGQNCWVMKQQTLLDEQCWMFQDFILAN